MPQATAGRRAVLVGAAMLAGSAMLAGPAMAVLDARTISPMRLRVVDWLHMIASDRQVFLIGFSVGWNHEADAEAAVESQKATRSLAILDLQLSRLANVPATAQSFLVTALVRAVLLERFPHLAIDGKYWKNLEMRHRVLVLQAFVAGAHSRAVWLELGKPVDTTTLGYGLERAETVARSPYPVNPNVMLTRLLDYYDGEESLEVLLAEAVRKVGRHRPGVATDAD